MTEQEKKFHDWFVKMVKEVDEFETKQLEKMNEIIEIELKYRSILNDKQDNKFKK